LSSFKFDGSGAPPKKSHKLRMLGLFLLPESPNIRMNNAIMQSVDGRII
jgi:hypothetical protein